MELELRNVTKDFVSRSGSRHNCIEGMNLIIRSGEFHLFYGASGSGKTTLLNMMTGMLCPSQGQILLEGKEIQNKNGQELTLLRRERFGYAMQNASLLGSLTVYENVALPLSFFARRDTKEAEECLQRAGLWKVRDSYPQELSGGEYRRCTILRALILKPDFLFADEPTSNLDDENARLIMEMLDRLRGEGTAVVVATHDKRFIDDSRKVHWLGSEN